METTFLIEDVVVLQNGKVAFAGVSQGRAVQVGMRATAVTASGEINIEVVSIGIVDPPPKNPDKKLLQVRVTGGDARLLKSMCIELK